MLQRARDTLSGVLFHQIEPRIRGVVMTTVQEEINGITAQFKAGIGEVVAKIGDLEAQVKAGKKPDLSELKKLAQDLDDIVPGTPTTPPAEPEPEPETEPDADAAVATETAPE